MRTGRRTSDIVIISQILFRSNSSLRLIISTIVYDTLFHPSVERVKSRMVVLADKEFLAAKGDLPNPKLCPRR